MRDFSLVNRLPDEDPETASSTVRRASSEDLPGAVATVVAAFTTDPAWAFLLGGDYERLAPRFAAALFKLRVTAGNVWITGGRSAVAMWNAPGPGPAAGAQEIWDEYRATAGESAHARLLQYNGAVAAAASPEPHWYLGVLATHPAHQREGLACSVLAPVLANADRDQIACCLETSTEQNRRFYERRGFTEVTTVVFDGGPPIWWLRRPHSGA